jgi:hypothetical protein
MFSCNFPNPGNILPPDQLGQDYLTRSAAAWKYTYINAAVEAPYPSANMDGNDDAFPGEPGSVYDMKCGLHAGLSAGKKISTERALNN